MKRTDQQNKAISADELREILSYDAETGVFVWRKDRHKVRANTVAGSTKHAHGYVYIKIYGRMYKAHRLAWLYVYGEWPKDMIDHINHVRNDNRITNLRQATNSVNQQNSLLRKDNKSGQVGVVQHRPGAWKAYINADGKKKTLRVI